jgi:hypothetical protein
MWYLALNHFRLTPISSPSTSNEVSSDTVRGPLSRPLYIATVTSSERTSGKSSPSVSSGIYSILLTLLF